MKLKPRNWIWIGLLVFIVGFRVFGSSVMTMSDEELQQLIESGQAEEALEWAKEAEETGELRTVFEFDNDKSLSIIQRLYELGAAKVTAVDIDSEPGFGETTNILIVELPSDPAARKKLFQYESKHSGGFGFVGVKDTGQRLLFLYWT